MVSSQALAQPYAYTKLLGWTFNGVTLRPDGMGIDPSGALWATDLANRQVFSFDGEGQFLRAFPTTASPRRVEFDRQGNAFVLVNSPMALQKFDPSGHLLKTFGSISTSDSYSGLAVDSQGNVFVSKSTNQVLKFNNSGSLVL